VPYGVDASRFRPAADVRAATREAAGLAWATPILFAAGRLVRKKGFEYLIDAVRLVNPPAQLVIAGTGDLDGELRARAAAAGVADRVRFLGDVPQDAVASWFAAADVAVVPSVRDASGNVDGLPNTVLEALASGTPVVATPAGGIANANDDGRTGMLVAERDPAALAGAMTALLADPARRSAMGQAARASVEARFGWGAAAARFEAAYDRAIAFKSLTK
jgi:glycosyltransferase involved in cell wall biosynthesis